MVKIVHIVQQYSPAVCPLAIYWFLSDIILGRGIAKLERYRFSADNAFNDDSLVTKQNKDLIGIF